MAWGFTTVSILGRIQTDPLVEVTVTVRMEGVAGGGEGAGAERECVKD